MYYVKVNWYDSFRGEDKISYMFVCAEGWNEAMLKVNDCFADINSIDMKHLIECEDGVIFIPGEAMAKDIINENDW